MSHLLSPAAVAASKPLRINVIPYIREKCGRREDRAASVRWARPKIAAEADSSLAPTNAPARRLGDIQLERIAAPVD